MHPNYSRHGLRATDLCAAVTPERVTSASSAQFGMILAADGSPCLSRQLQDAEIAETWPLLPAPQRGSAGSWPVPHSSGALRNKSCLWTFLLHIPCAKEKVCSEPVGQDFLSGAADLVVPVRQLNIPCRFGIIWWLGGGQGPTPAFLCTLDTLTVTTASLRQDIPFPTSKFNSPSKVGS